MNRTILAVSMMLLTPGCNEDYPDYTEVNGTLISEEGEVLGEEKLGENLGEAGVCLSVRDVLDTGNGLVSEDIYDQCHQWFKRRNEK